MIQQWLNVRTLFFLVAIGIVTGTVFYSQYLADKIEKDETQRVSQWVEAGKLLVSDSSGISTRLVGDIISENRTIPIIETDESGHIITFANLDSAKVSEDKNYVSKKLADYRARDKPIVWTDPTDPAKKNLYYYGHTLLLNEIRYYPIVQLLIVILFIIVTIIAQRTMHRSVQNQLWAGMAKETAHQLGTPVSSLRGWVEVLKDVPGNEKIVAEIEKDVNRLELISDRFGKIGSQPHLEEKNVVEQVKNMMEYMRKRAGGKVDFILDTKNENTIIAMISPPLFDWVIENLIKNALDAMEGHGRITITIQQLEKDVIIDVTDTGKGIAKANISKVFKPGFTTKKRGWGLGLTLSKRIAEQYHNGKIFVKWSEPGKGTTFRLELNKG